MAIGNLLNAFRKQKDASATALPAPTAKASTEAAASAKSASPRLNLFDDSAFEEVTRYGDHMVSKSGQYAARSPSESIFEKVK